MNNGWNRIIYKVWSPVYDRFFNSGIFLKARKELFKDISLSKGSRVLFVGVGTGADLPFFLNKGYEIKAIDYSADMLKVAKEKYEDPSITFYEMDAQSLEFEDESFDFIVASLILSVVPNPEKAYCEINRVLTTEGHFIIFDKFVPKNKKMTIGQRMVRPVIKLMGTDIGIDFYHVHKNVKNNCIITLDQGVMMKGLYRKINGIKKGETS